MEVFFAPSRIGRTSKLRLAKKCVMQKEVISVSVGKNQGVGKSGGPSATYIRYASGMEKVQSCLPPYGQIAATRSWGVEKSLIFAG
jgi:hypothetical protein